MLNLNRIFSGRNTFQFVGNYYFRKMIKCRKAFSIKPISSLFNYIEMYFCRNAECRIQNIEDDLNEQNNNKRKYLFSPSFRIRIEIILFFSFIFQRRPIKEVANGLMWPFKPFPICSCEFVCMCDMALYDLPNRIISNSYELDETESFTGE